MQPIEVAYPNGVAPPHLLPDSDMSWGQKLWTALLPIGAAATAVLLFISSPWIVLSVALALAGFSNSEYWQRDNSVLAKAGVTVIAVLGMVFSIYALGFAAPILAFGHNMLPMAASSFIVAQVLPMVVPLVVSTGIPLPESMSRVANNPTIVSRSYFSYLTKPVALVWSKITLVFDLAWPIIKDYFEPLLLWAAIAAGVAAILMTVSSSIIGAALLSGAFSPGLVAYWGAHAAWSILLIPLNLLITRFVAAADNSQDGWFMWMSRGLSVLSTGLAVIFGGLGLFFNMFMPAAGSPVVIAALFQGMGSVLSAIGHGIGASVSAVSGLPWVVIFETIGVVVVTGVAAYLGYRHYYSNEDNEAYSPVLPRSSSAGLLDNFPPSSSPLPVQSVHGSEMGSRRLSASNVEQKSSGPRSEPGQRSGLGECNQ